MTQLDLFDSPDLTAPVAARARRADPETSHIAAAGIELTGTASAHRSIIVSYLKQNPGETTGEIAEGCGLKHQQVWRRMAELEEMNLVIHGTKRLCKVQRTLCRPWYPK